MRSPCLADHISISSDAVRTRLRALHPLATARGFVRCLRPRGRTGRSGAEQKLRPAFVLLILLPLWGADSFPVKIQVDASRPQGPMKPVWAFFGYDEPNYTYMKDGTRLLTQLSELSPVPVYVRTHNLLTSGDGTPSLKWGSTNAYTEDAQGRPKYDWTITDRIFDTYVQRKMKPLVEIGFMPEALSSQPQPYRHNWRPEQSGASIKGGWAYPPKDYDKWRELVYQWARHCVERYGRAEVESWWWEVWNEPNIVYWQGTPEEYQKLYDYAADGLKRALPGARIGGPHSTGPGSARAAEFLRGFLEHALHGTNFATGKKGSPLDYVGFHAKGRPEVNGDHVRMGIQYQLRDIEEGFKVVASFPELKGKPVIIGESDPEGCAACPQRFHPQNAYRNGTVYSSYTAASFARKYLLAAKYGVNLEGAVTWAFEFENQPWFDGFRDLATNGVEKPVLNVFRMFGQMQGENVAVVSSGDAGLEEMAKAGVRGAPDVSAMAVKGERSLRVLVWHYHDDDVAGPAAEVEVEIRGVSGGNGRVRLRQARIDGEHSNAYAMWKAMGSPQPPSAAQVKELRKRAGLEWIDLPAWSEKRGGLKLPLSLPRQGVSLLELNW